MPDLDVRSAGAAWAPLSVTAALFVALFVAPATVRAEAQSCGEALEALGVETRPVQRRGIDDAVEVLGPIGGVEYVGFRKRRLVLDCSLVYSLARAGRWLRDHGIEKVIFSSAYQRRNVRGTKRPSKHSYGLALDVHRFVGADLELDIRDHYEQGLGDDLDCIGEPLTAEGRVLRTVECQLERSELFEMLLGPDYDAHHYNHFHVEAAPWKARAVR